MEVAFMKTGIDTIEPLRQNCNSASPFEHASKLWGANSCPLDLERVDVSPKVQEGLRAQFETPEAVEGFTVQAYRPASLPTDMEPELELLPSLKSRPAPLEWNEVDECAISLAGTPMHRTDVPLARFAPARRRCSQSIMRRISMDEKLHSRRTMVELSARSSSAPASYEALVVDDLWADVPTPAVANPFEGLPDNCGFFR